MSVKSDIKEERAIAKKTERRKLRSVLKDPRFFEDLEDLPAEELPTIISPRNPSVS